MMSQPPCQQRRASRYQNRNRVSVTAHKVALQLNL
ncbi:hypothetical protein A2U01_0094916, partial [Trifolium medium]|nr:hypothetical protein [Trifolium medium]